jgi:hypothetical protein
MDRFKEDFNNVDPITGRPFSSGHPDGVWIISIIYSLVIIASIGSFIFGTIQLFSNPEGALGGVVSGVINVGVYGSIILFLFKRSIIAAYINWFATVLIGVATTISFINIVELKFYLLAAFAVHLYIVFYINGLAKDGLLNNQKFSNKRIKVDV